MEEGSETVAGFIQLRTLKAGSVRHAWDPVHTSCPRRFRVKVNYGISNIRKKIELLGRIGGANLLFQIKNGI